MMSGEDIRLRKAEQTDLAALLDLENRCFDGDRMSRRSYRRLLGRDSAEILVAETTGGDGLAGSAVLFFHRTRHAARLYSLAIDKERRGLGLGKRMLEFCEQISREKGKPALRLEVRKDNQPAITLYEKADYRLIGSRSGYYHDGMDALRYEKPLEEL